ncbi:MAG: DUF6525 family protein [Albimonas sp.]|uniref:DUF6525 family protein n=1 Tax=Albimonas sp. TaxID=1872425 RepID=UPI004057331D
MSGGRSAAGARGNLATDLARRRRRGDPMDGYDRLPRELRRWLAQAALPWSPRSCLRLWRAELRRAGGDPVLAAERMSRIETRRLAADAASVWGRAHPAAGLPAG